MSEAQKPTTALSYWTNNITDLVVSDFKEHGEAFDGYAKTCAMNAMSNIYELVKSDGTDMQNIDTSNLRQIVAECAGLRLNANAFPREVYFQIRNKKIGDKYVKTVELGIESAGMETMMREYGADVKRLYDWWIVREGDEFVYPHRKGLEITPPEWEEKGMSQKVARVVLPVEKTDGTVIYLISEREGVMVNLRAHVKNNLMNETFGICENRYKATAEQKTKIQAKKDEIYAELDKCTTVDEMLACPVARPYISDAWLSSTESMIITKLKNNAIRKYPKNFSNIARRSFLETDEVYKATQEDIEENENSIPFDDANVVESTAREVVDNEIEGAK